MRVTLAELPEFAEKFVSELPQIAGAHAYVIGLKGELGAGKTTFTQAVARALNAGSPVTSPTYTIAQRYAITHPPFTSLIHMDAYRVSPGDSHTIGWDLFFNDPANLLIVEWPERLPGYMPHGAPILKFSVGDVGSREIEYAERH
ncbi:MAG: tRNA (adenosine(37)-N6)-threonylcarbamoyltransferase complex ATPase subunit type 1 TsaE [Patescibacteria group bacterium]